MFFLHIQWETSILGSSRSSCGFAVQTSDASWHHALQPESSDAEAAASFVMLTDGERTEAEVPQAGALKADATSLAVAVAGSGAAAVAGSGVAAAGPDAAPCNPYAMAVDPKAVSEPGTLDSSSKEGTLESKGSSRCESKKRPSAGTVSPSPSMIAEVMGPDTEEVRQKQFEKMKALVADLDQITANLKLKEAEEKGAEPKQEEKKDASGMPSVVEGHPEPSFGDDVDWGDNEASGRRNGALLLKSLE